MSDVEIRYNSSDTHHASDTSDYFPLNYRIVATVIHVIIFCLGVVGNIVMIVVAKRTRSLQSPTFNYLVSLAYADLIVLISAIPEAIVEHHTGRRWLLGQTGCSLFVFFNFLGINAGSLSILAFTVEQYIAVCGDYLRRFRMTERSQKYVWGLWIFSIMYCCPWLGLTEVRPDEDDPLQWLQCELRLSPSIYTGFFATDIVLFYVVPLAFALVAYTKIAGVLLKSFRYCNHDSPRASLTRVLAPNVNINASNAEPAAGSIARSKSSCSTAGFIHDSSRNRVTHDHLEWIIQSRTQVLRMLVATVVLFAVAWLPYRGLLVYNSFVSEPWWEIWYVLFAKTLIYVNSAMNPFLYNAMSRRFRLAVRRTLACLPKKNRKRGNILPANHHPIGNIIGFNSK